MKCINCQTDNKLKERTANSGRCKQCNHKFVFRPTYIPTIGLLTDPMFAKAIANISVNDTLFFTPKQLFYLLDKRFNARPSNWFTVAGYVFINVLFLFLSIFIGLISGLIFVAGGISVFLAILVVNIFWITAVFTASRSSKYLYKQREIFAKNLQRSGKILLIGGIGISLLSSSFLLFLGSSALGILSIYLGNLKVEKTLKGNEESSINSYQFESWIKTWIAINPIAKMLPPPRDSNASATINPDVSAYSFDRLVVCDSPEIAQFLITNNFHFENNCAILCVTGYPKSIFDTTMEMLRRNPDLKVYALHDCSPKGLGLVNQLRTSPNWFPDNSAIIIDIGLLPRQIIAGGDNMFVLSSQQNAQDAAQLPAEIRQDLFSDELKWLELGNYVELESFSPQKLIQILNRGIAGSRDLGSDDSSLILLGGTESSIYVVDSFG